MEKKCWDDDDDDCDDDDDEGIILHASNDGLALASLWPAYRIHKISCYFEAVFTDQPSYLNINQIYKFGFCVLFVSSRKWW